MVKEVLKNLVSVMVHVFPRHPFVLCNVILPNPCDCVMMGSKEIICEPDAGEGCYLHVFSFLHLYAKHWLDSRFNFKLFTAHISHYKIFDYKYQSARFFPRRSSPKCQIQIQNKRTQLMCHVSL